MEFVDVLSRWIHVLTAIVVVGGSVFMRWVLMPAAESLDEATHAGLRERVIGRWRLFVMIGIALFLLTGFYNYIAVAIPAHRNAPSAGLYHGLMGVKIILAVVVFFLGSALVGRSPALETFRRDSKKWLTVAILVAAVVVGIASYLKVALSGTTAGEVRQGVSGRADRLAGDRVDCPRIGAGSPTRGRLPA